MTYQILQLKHEYIKDFGFLSYKFITKNNKISLDRYNVIYESSFRDDTYESSIDALEDLFCIFNFGEIKDFKGHSMSTSDIVKLGDTYYYCDDCGWVKLDF